MDLKTPLPAVLRTTRDFVESLESLDLRTVEDLLLYLPRAHEDLTQSSTIASAQIGEKVTIVGVLTGIKLVRIRGGRKLLQAKFTDTQGDTVDVVWFNQPHLQRMLEEGKETALTGKLALNGRKVTFQSPTFETLGDKPRVHSGRLVPVYPQHDRINTRWLREKMSLIRPAITLLPETLPQEVLDEEKLMKRSEAVEALHFPEDPAAVDRAHQRLAFERMFELQKEALSRKREWQELGSDRIKTPMDAELIRSLFRSLKYEPTKSQRIAIFEILQDMERSVPMSRLLEGDVGSGKTLVAVSVMAHVLHHHAQCALMVPTEVLARQHAASVSRTLLQFHTYLQTTASESIKNFPLPRVALLTGSMTAAESDTVRDGLMNGTVDIVVGTHALIEDKVQFRDLRLVIIDEQHRFGVNQRRRLREKGSPHLLSMTATPIPRTLALTAYGDHDLSVLLEKPGRRQAIDTTVVNPKNRKTVELFIRQQLGEGRQAFVICPLIEESDELADVRNVTAEADRLRESFPEFTVALLHGKMDSAEKQRIMQDFRDKKSHLLVSTSVIEVGIDVPNSTIICIEGAERFGLAQLHQLRGRVGRGDFKSYCFLFTSNPSQAESPRLKAMEKYDSGFLLAEMDLKLRGPGELYGLRQSGIPDAEASMLLNPDVIARARRAAEKALGLRVFARTGI